MFKLKTYLNKTEFEGFEEALKNFSRSFDDFAYYLNKTQKLKFLSNSAFVQFLLDNRYITEKFCLNYLQSLLHYSSWSIIGVLCTNAQFVEFMLKNDVFSKVQQKKKEAWLKYESMPHLIYDDILLYLGRQKTEEMKHLCEMHKCLLHFKNLTVVERKELLSSKNISQYVEKLKYAVDNNLDDTFDNFDSLLKYLNKKAKKQSLNI